jgi:hypothetical protein
MDTHMYRAAAIIAAELHLQNELSFASNEEKQAYSRFIGGPGIQQLAGFFLNYIYRDNFFPPGLYADKSNPEKPFEPTGEKLTGDIEKAELIPQKKGGSVGTANTTGV